MSVVTRKFSACPVRTAAQTWEAIIDVLSSDNESVRATLCVITGIAASLISEATPQTNPITIIGSGPRLRIYCLYEEDGSTEDANEASLNWNLFDGDWQIYFPVAKSDLKWVAKALNERGSRFKTYEVGTEINAEIQNAFNPSVLSINIEKLKSNG